MIASTISSSSSVTPEIARRGARVVPPTLRAIIAEGSRGLCSGPSPPSLPSAPSETISYGALCDGETYLYSLPHGSFGTVERFQYGPFQFVTPGGAVISACRPSCVVG